MRLKIVLKPEFPDVENNEKDNCMKIKTLLYSGLLACTVLYGGQLYAISAAVRSYQDYTLTLGTLRNMQIMVENFGDEQLRKKHAEIKTMFQDASETQYSQNFTSSELKFKKLKTELIKILEAVDDIYLKRTKMILDSTSKESFDVLLEYGKEGGMAKYLGKPFDPLKDKKTIDPSMYHLFHDRGKITTYLREGYKKYEKAMSLFNDPDIAYLKKKANPTSQSVNLILTSLAEVVYLCREAKQNGIEIMKILYMKEEGKSLVKYKITHGSIIPIFDDRIPEKYKVDANDNLRLIHSVEQKRLTAR